MSVNIRELLQRKESGKSGMKLELKDINHDLIIALLAVPVYGKETRDEEILSIIVNGGMEPPKDYLNVIRSNYAELFKAKKVKKAKDGVMRDEEGFIVLVPHAVK